ncbi:MAG TPA: aspartate/glutamate racemase family protein [Acidimicrobiia bacterium]|nr:aspartate/glutamate racemase family protein [Acidimicrobiia bacterium]
MRIAFVMGEYPGAEFERRAEKARSYSGPDLDVDVLKVGVSPYRGLMTPMEVQMAAPLFIEAYRRAEREGYDAAVPLGFLDLGVEGGRSAVDIPIVGALQASLRVADLLGDRFGFIVYRDESIGPARARVQAYGMADRISGFQSSKMKMTQYAEAPGALEENFLTAARSLIDSGADVIIPAGVSQCPVHLDPRWLTAELGIPVVDGFGAPIHMAASLARLGLAQSRIRHPRSEPPESGA